jgi:ABC-2 type transport system ATP-binding protein
VDHQLILAVVEVNAGRRGTRMPGHVGQRLLCDRRYRDLRWPMRLVGALLDAGAIHPGRRARDHLAWLAASNQLPGCRVGEVLGLTGLDRVATRRVGSFSLGMRQRLGIAAALLGDPGVLLLDEPVNGLDPEGVRWIRTLMRSLAAEGRTVLLSSHLMSEMALTADRLIIIGRGRLLADSDVSEFVRTAGPGASLEDAYMRLTAPSAEYRASHYPEGSPR